MIRKLIGMGLLLLAVVAGCQQESVTPQVERPEREITREDRLKDSVYVYTHGFYLWQDALPDWFSDVRSHTSRYNSANAVLQALMAYAVDEEGETYDRFSFLDRWGTVSAEIEQGMMGSFGFDVRYADESTLYVKKVE